VTPYLSDPEVDGICAGLTRPSAMVRYLRREGFAVKTKPNGRPLLARANFDAVMAGRSAAETAADERRAAEPDAGALIDFFSRKKVQYARGPQAKTQSPRAS
jgi:hypothetical protein